MLELFPQLADMAFDHVLIDVLVKQSIDGVEDLGLADTATAATKKEFKDASLAARQWKGLPVCLWFTPVEIYSQLSDRNVPAFTEDPTIYRTDTRQDFAHMDRFADDIVHPGCKQTQRVVQRVTFIETQEGSCRSLSNETRKRAAFVAVADQERLHGLHIGITDFADPLAKLKRVYSGRRYTLTIESRCVSVRHNVAIVYDDIHGSRLRGSVLDYASYAYDQGSRDERNRTRRPM